jgi:hypothetical protein
VLYAVEHLAKCTEEWY